jgi:hypothetical protein
MESDPRGVQRDSPLISQELGMVTMDVENCITSVVHNRGRVSLRLHFL